MDTEKLKRVWNQKLIPVVIRTGKQGQKLRVRLPFADDNRDWLNTLGKSKVVWINSRKYWELPVSWFNDFVNAALSRYRKLYVIQPFRIQENCSPACMNATGHICECSCMGEHHGAGNNGSWFEVSEKFATRWKEQEVACRLMIAKGGNQRLKMLYDMI